MLTRASIDPGMTGTAVAIWSSSKANWKTICNPIDTINIYSNLPDERWLTRSYLMCDRVIDYLRKFEVSKCYIEYPAFMSGSAAGNAAAAKGDLVKLSIFWGILWCKCFQARFEPIEVPVINWKGQLPKEEVERRIRKLLPDLDEKVKSHSIDAVGIGLYKKGVWRV